MSNTNANHSASTGWCVIDIETTGLYAGAHDRIVEVGAVLLSPDGEVEQEWQSLVNPDRDLGPAHIHQLTAAMISKAPSFGDVAGDILALMSGRYLAAHNARFEQGFLEVEYERSGGKLGEPKFLCTMLEASRMGIPRSLKDCCAVVGIENTGPHTALGDARATAELLKYLLRCNPNLRSAASVFASPVKSRLSGRAINRESATLASKPKSYVGRLVERVPTIVAPSGEDDARLQSYLELLDRVLEDRVVSSSELKDLGGAAIALGMGIEDVAATNLQYLRGLVAIAKGDGIVTAGEKSDLDRVTALLGIENEVLNALLKEGKPTDSSGVVGDGTEFDGASVCFTGSSTCKVRGKRITRSLAQKIAEDAGLSVEKDVSRALDVLVVTDPDTRSGKARKARKYGIRIVSERSFWTRIGVMID